MRISHKITITICADNLQENTNADIDTFYSNKQTVKRILEIANQEQIEVEKTIFLNTPYRFKAEELQHLAENMASPFYKKYDNLLTNEITYNTHQGIFVVRSNDVNAYLKKYCPIQLRYNKIKHVNTNFNALNYRETKGCTYDRTLIYPTKDLENYLKDKKEISKINTKNAIYVALSRAINSVAIVYDGKVDEKLNIKVWEENNEQ